MKRTFLIYFGLFFFVIGAVVLGSSFRFFAVVKPGIILLLGVSVNFICGLIIALSGLELTFRQVD